MSLAVFWFVVLTVLWMGFLLLEGFDFGVGMLHGVIGRDEPGRRAVIGTIGPVWDGNEVWLVTAAAATFAAFPSWYATMFSAFYPVMLLTLVALILRGVSFEFRSHVTTDRARRLWSAALTGGSAVIPLLLGIVLGGLLHGLPINADHEFVGGFGDLLAPYAVFTGVTVMIMCLLHGAVFLGLRTRGELRDRAHALARPLAPLAAALVLGFAIWTRVDSGGVLFSLAEFVVVLLALAVVPLVWARRDGGAFAATCATLAGLVLAIFADLYPHVMVSTLGAADDLTVNSTASAHYALTVMTVVLAVLLPVVLTYQAWSLYVFRHRLGGDDRNARSEEAEV